MSSSIADPKTFTPDSDMGYTKMKINSVGGKSVGIVNNSTSRQLTFTTPLMMNWGVNVFENKDGSKSYTLALQFPRDDFETDETNDFLNMLKSMESKLLEDAVKNSKDWFGKSQSKEVIEAFWNPILKYPKNPDTKEPDYTRSPTLKIKLPVWDGKYKFELFDEDGTLLLPNDDDLAPEDIIQKGSKIKCILQCGGIWMANGSFGVSWKMFQAVYKGSDSLEVGKGICHIPTKLSSSDNTSSENVVPNVEKTTLVESDEEEEDATEKVVEDATEEVVEDTTEEVVEEPVKKPKKKRVVKKKD